MPSTKPPSPKRSPATHLGFSVSTHLLRKSCATDLAWTAGIEDAVRRRFMGHRAGDDVFGRIYTLDHPDVAPLAKVAEILDHNIAITIGSLMTPTIRRCPLGRRQPHPRPGRPHRRHPRRGGLVGRSRQRRRPTL